MMDEVRRTTKSLPPSFILFPYLGLQRNMI